MSITVEEIGNRKIAIGGVGKMFYQDGYPISIAVSELKKQGIEVSFLHMIEEFWNNGWSWKTIEMKLRGELSDDIEGVIKLDFAYLNNFYNCLEQPRRSNGGYEESREMIYQYLFCETSKDAVEGKSFRGRNWFLKRVVS